MSWYRKGHTYSARGLYNLQGSTTIQGSVVGSSSSGPAGRLYTGRPGRAVADHPWGAFPEDLYSETLSGSLLSVTEMRSASGRNGRTVFGVPVAALSLGTTEPAGAGRRTCPGAVPFSKTPTVVVTLRGVSCPAAKAVLPAYDRGTPPAPWACALAHAPFTRIGKRIVGLSCGAGGGGGSLRKRPHAFLGTVRAQ